MRRQLLASISLSVLLFSAPALASDTAPTDMSFDNLLKAYAASNPDMFKNNERMEAAWMQRFHCREYLESKNNEFAAPDMLGKARSEIAALPAAPATYTILTEARFGSYDRQQGQFPFSLIGERQTSLGFQFDAAGNRNYGNALNGGLACVPQNVMEWPDDFKVTLTNPEAINGIKLPMEEAKAFLEKNPSRNLNVRLTVKPTEWGRMGIEQTCIPLKAEIVAADLLDGKNQVVYSYDAAALAATSARLAQEKAAAVAAEAVAPIELTGSDHSWSVARAWIAHLKGTGPDTLPDGTKLREFKLGWSNGSGATISEAGGLNFGLSIDPAEPVPPDGYRVAGKGADEIIVTVVNYADFIKPISLTAEQYQGMRGMARGDKCYGSCFYKAYVVLQPINAKEVTKPGHPHFNIPDTVSQTLQTKIVRLVVTPTNERGQPSGVPEIVIEAK